MLLSSTALSISFLALLDDNISNLRMHVSDLENVVVSVRFDIFASTVVVLILGGLGSL